MSTRQISDMAASVMRRLLNLAKTRGDDFNFLLSQYVVERLLFRLSQSEYAKDFVLKGAMLFHLRSRQMPHRPTHDLDLMRTGSPDVTRMEHLFRNVDHGRRSRLTCKTHCSSLFLSRDLHRQHPHTRSGYAKCRRRTRLESGAWGGNGFHAIGESDSCRKSIFDVMLSCQTPLNCRIWGQTPFRIGVDTCCGVV